MTWFKGGRSDMNFWAGLQSLAHLLPAQPTKLNRAVDTELELPADTVLLAGSPGPA